MILLGATGFDFAQVNFVSVAFHGHSLLGDTHHTPRSTQAPRPPNEARVPGTIWSRCARPLIPAVIASGSAARQPSAATAGVTLAEIAELIALDSTNDCARTARTAGERLAALDEKIAVLEGARTALGRLRKTCTSRTKGSCPILEAFEE
jgi:hypothetical protein